MVDFIPKMRNTDHMDISITASRQGKNNIPKGRPGNHRKGNPYWANGFFMAKTDHTRPYHRALTSRKDVFWRYKINTNPSKLRNP